MSRREEKLELEGEVRGVGNGMFRIRLEGGHETIGYVAGKVKQAANRVLPGDRVRIELSGYDLTRGRIVHRLT